LKPNAQNVDQLTSMCSMKVVT